MRGHVSRFASVAVLGCACAAWSSSAFARGIPDPLLRYTFDEGSGQALDSGTAPLTPGDLLGGATRSTDTPGGFSPFAVDFTNETPYAHVLEGDASDLDGLGQLTLTTWLKVNTYTAGNNRLSAKQNGGANFDGFSWNMNATPNSGTVGPDNFRLGLFLGGSAGFASVFSNDDVGAVEWTFLAVTYDSASGAVNFYSGGVNTPVTQVGTTLTANAGVIDALTARYGVGFTDAAATANTSVIGLQDDVRVYGAALDVTSLDAVRLQNVPEPSSAAILLASLLPLLGRWHARRT
jgi:hypothetical protein